jgi:hypothetical protein
MLGKCPWNIVRKPDMSGCSGNFGLEIDFGD